MRRAREEEPAARGEGTAAVSSASEQRPQAHIKQTVPSLPPASHAGNVAGIEKPTGRNDEIARVEKPLTDGSSHIKPSLPPPPGDKKFPDKAATAKDAPCTGEFTSNGCITAPTAPPHKPTSVVIGKQPDKPAPKAGQSSQQTTTTRRGEGTSIFQSSTRTSSGTTTTTTTSTTTGSMSQQQESVATSSAACDGAPPASAVYPDPWQSGNLNQRYGSSWSCNMISLVPREACQLYYSCLPCMNSNQDFYEDAINSGHCVPRAAANQPSTNQPTSEPMSQPSSRPSPAPQPNPARPAVSIVQQPQFVPSDNSSTAASRVPEGPPNSWPPSAPLSTCEGQIERGAAVCVHETGSSNSPMCRRQAVLDCSCDPSTDRCRGLQACTPALQAKAKINVDWVFSNAGAKATYQLHRSMGESAFQAVESAQAHNTPVQALLRECQGWVEDYLHQQGGCTLGRNPPGPQDCSCVSVIPTGSVDDTGTPYYRVIDSCPEDHAFNVSVGFVDAHAGGNSPSYGQPQLSCPSQPFTVRPPQTYPIPSISSINLQNAGGTYTCVCRTAACN
jgi:hypothetical protein